MQIISSEGRKIMDFICPAGGAEKERDKKWLVPGEI
jgi:hypothetical protein